MRRDKGESLDFIRLAAIQGQISYKKRDEYEHGWAKWKKLYDIRCKILQVTNAIRNFCESSFASVGWKQKVSQIFMLFFGRLTCIFEDHQGVTLLCVLIYHPTNVSTDLHPLRVRGQAFTDKNNGFRSVCQSYSLARRRNCPNRCRATQPWPKPRQQDASQPGVAPAGISLLRLLLR